MTGSNLIKCRFCNWQTTKISATSNTEKAFARLRRHQTERHFEAADDIQHQAYQHGLRALEIIADIEVM